MHRILLVEDGLDFQKMVEVALGADFVARIVPNLAEAREALRSETFDLLLLDVMLPDGDGFKFCASLQSDDLTRDLPIIFLTGKSEIEDRVLGLSLGAEDYIIKPFAPSELRARVSARLKKIGTKKAREESFRKGDLHFNLAFQRISILKGGQETSLEVSPLEFKLLLYMARHEGQVFSRDQLMTSVWGDKVNVVDRTVDVHVSSLRKKIALSAYTLRSVHKVGYALTLKTEERSAA